MRGLALVGVGATFLMAASAALAQSGPPEAGPFGIATYGVFRELMHKGDFSPKTTLQAAMASRPTIGVGALAQAQGEITLLDGRLIVSRGQPDASAPPGGESAALLATAKVTTWHALPVGFDVPPDKVEAFLANRARAYGLDPDKSFPFKLRGAVAPYAMHVNAAPLDGPRGVHGAHGMGRPMAVTVDRKGDEIAGQVVGLYVAPALVGVATHGGERVHAHWVADDGSETAHLDLWGIRRGSTLMLPQAK